MNVEERRKTMMQSIEKSIEEALKVDDKKERDDDS
jgi:hypothetical protein